jgi:hypothetical protein
VDTETREVLPDPAPKRVESNNLAFGLGKEGRLARQRQLAALKTARRHHDDLAFAPGDKVDTGDYLVVQWVLDGKCGASPAEVTSAADAKGNFELIWFEGDLNARLNKSKERQGGECREHLGEDFSCKNVWENQGEKYEVWKVACYIQTATSVSNVVKI